LREADLKKLLANCERDTSFTGRRDYALLRVLIDTDIRRAEVAGLRFTPADDSTQDVDLDQSILRVMGKGRRERPVGIGRRTSSPSIAICAHARSTRRPPPDGYGWAARGRLTDPGVRTRVDRRGVHGPDAPSW